MLPFSPRFIILTICAVITALLVTLGGFEPRLFKFLWIPILIFGGLTALGFSDLLEKSHAVLRNYPITAHIRFLLEEIRPEMRQYFFESEKMASRSAAIPAPWSISAPRWCSTTPFGTQEDIYGDGYEWMHHSVAPKPLSDEHFRITIGGPDCAKPYSASVLNISAMSFGALSPNAVRALNAGAKKGNFAHDTGEGGVSPYHRENGGDLIWERQDEKRADERRWNRKADIDRGPQRAEKQEAYNRGQHDAEEHGELQFLDVLAQRIAE